MIEGWEWDVTLFRGAARYYEQGRLPYPPGLADAVQQTLGLDGAGRLLDVGCGPGSIALRLAHLFAEVVGLDADPEMVAEGARRAAERGITNARWVEGRAEDLPLGLGSFRVASFASSFHWMDRDTVAAKVREMLESGGMFLQISTWHTGAPDPDPLPYPPPPRAEIDALIQRWLGPVRRAGQGVIRGETPGDEPAVLRRAGFGEPEIVVVPGRQVLTRTVDDLVAFVFSGSGSAPHHFGERVGEFEAELRALLEAHATEGLFAEQTSDAELRVWRK